MYKYDNKYGITIENLLEKCMEDVKLFGDSERGAMTYVLYRLLNESNPRDLDDIIIDYELIQNT
jgi:hypothetical protein